jgi:polysaccharide export outer membrane protein
MMRTATFSALIAGFCIGISAQAQDEAPKPKPAEVLESGAKTPAGPQSDVDPSKVDPSKVDPSKLDPSKADPSKVDPSKMAEPAASSAAKPPSVPGLDAKRYILGAEDMIAITVWQSPAFSGSHMIRPDGKITIPLIGEVEASGLTPEAFGNSIQEKLKKVLKDPDVSVSVTQVNSRRYFIEGEVNKPGEYKLVVPTHVLEALVNAGGFKDFAHQSDITIMRGTGRLKFNYKSAIKGKDLDKNVFLEPGDIIIVH